MKASARVVAALMTALVATSCGTTVPNAARTAEGTFGVGATPVAAPGGVTAPGGDLGNTDRAVAALHGGGSPADQRPTSAGPAPLPVAVPPSTGSVLRPVEVGVYVARNAAAFGNMIGGSAYSGFDQEAHARAIVDYVNRHGGLAGHQIKVVVTSLDATGSDTWATQEQAACEAMTRDHHVVAVLDIYVGILANLDDCLRARHVPLIVASQLVYDRPWYTGGDRFSTEMPMWNRAVTALVETTTGRGSLTKATKTGLLAYDNPVGHRHAEQVWKPVLAARGMTAPDVAYVHAPTSTQDVGNTVRDMQSVVLRWKAAGIQTVFDDPGLTGVFFYDIANAQDFHPFYALTTLSLPTSFNGKSGVRAAGIGWSMYYDTGAQPPRNAAYAECRQMSGGVWPTDGTGLAEALAACNAFRVLVGSAAASGLGTPEGVAQGVVRLRGQVQSGSTPGLYFDSSHPDGVTGYRDFAFDDGCRCFRYTSGIAKLP